jgi:hypothetical protein
MSKQNRMIAPNWKTNGKAACARFEPTPDPAL